MEIWKNEISMFKRAVLINLNYFPSIVCIYCSLQILTNHYIRKDISTLSHKNAHIQYISNDWRLKCHLYHQNRYQGRKNSSCIVELTRLETIIIWHYILFHLLTISNINSFTLPYQLFPYYSHQSEGFRQRSNDPPDWHTLALSCCNTPLHFYHNLHWLMQIWYYCDHLDWLGEVLYSCSDEK